MHTNAKRVLFWSPRLLGILFSLFVSAFALDVFGEGHGLWRTVGALLIHLVPAFLVALALAIAWRWEWVGAVLFNALALLYVLSVGGRFPAAAQLAISGPLVLVGFLFLLNWVYRGELRQR